MSRSPLARALLLLTAVAATAAAQEPVGSTPVGAAEPLPIPEAWDTAYVMLVEANPDWRPPSEEASQSVLQAHFQYQLRLIADGRTSRGGPLVQVPDAPLVGMTVLRAASLAEAEAIAGADPAVRAGMFRATVRTWTTPAAPPTPAADPADVSTIAGIMHAYYDVINGPPGQPRQWERDRTLYMPGAMFVSMSEQDGRPVVTPMTPQGYRENAGPYFLEYGAYEVEVGSRIERFGNVAQVRTVGEFRHSPDSPVLARYVNYVLLYWDGTRWWISGAIWDEERPGTEIPGDWVGTRVREGH
jgi:uncharacterized protein YciI